VESGLPPFDVAVVRDADVITLELTGELDYGTVPSLDSALALVGREHPGSALRIDLRHLDFIDSAGMSTLIAASASAKSRGVRLSVVRGPENVQRPLEVVGLDQILEFEDA
jgi:anti-sigma B factor antagonist